MKALDKNFLVKKISIVYKPVIGIFVRFQAGTVEILPSLAQAPAKLG